MPSCLIQSRRKGYKVENLSTSEAIFIQELLADDMWRPEQAAKRAGYKDPGAAANSLMRRPRIAAALGREQRRRLERIGLKAEEVLHLLTTALFFNPLSLFKPSASGKWVVTDLDKIPDEIGRTISKIKTKTTDTLHDDGSVTTETYFELELMDKSRLLELAMKHCGIDGTSKVRVEGNVGISVNGDNLLQNLLMEVENRRKNLIVDQKILEPVKVTNVKELSGA